MSKLKKIMIIIAIGICTILGIHTTSNALSVGEYMTVTIDMYRDWGTIYCCEHGQELHDTQTYRAISRVAIEGARATDHNGNVSYDWRNGALAYILASGADYGVRRNAIWSFIHGWIDSQAQFLDGVYDGFSNDVMGNGSGDSLIARATKYGKEMYNGREMKDNYSPKNTKLQAVSVQLNGETYIKIGPCNWKFAGQLIDIKMYDQDDKVISKDYKYSIYEGNEEKFLSSKQEITSDKDFYIYIPMGTDVTKVTKITATAHTMLYTAEVFFLQACYNANLQNLIIATPAAIPMDVTTTFKVEYPYKKPDNPPDSPPANPIDTNPGYPLIADLEIEKVNTDNHDWKLDKIGFILQHKETGLYVGEADATGKIKYVENKENAKEFFTDENGKIYISNLIVGNYLIYETENPHYGYEEKTEPDEIQISVKKNSKEEKKVSKIVIENKQIYVRLSGFVWIDKVDGKRSERNDLFNDADTEDSQIEGTYVPDGQDILYDGIEVRLIDRKTGEIVQTTTTSELGRYKEDVGHNGHGEYLFEDVLIEKLEDYYIEFEYNGLTYTNVLPNIDEDNGSKAVELLADREKLNKSFSTVEGETRNTGYTTDESGNKVFSLKYDINEEEGSATLIQDDQFNITADTDVGQYIIRDHFIYGIEEMKYINLGLYEREQPDYGIGKDLENVRVTINGYEHTYNYSQRFANQGEYSGGFNVGVKFGKKYGTDMTPYTTAIYKSDYDYVNENEKSRELKVYVTYRIRMENASANLKARFNSIVDYYDSRYKLVSAGTGLDEKGNVNGALDTTDSTYNDKYNKATIKTSSSMNPGTFTDIYVQFALSREAVEAILEDKDTANDTKELLDNIVEINSYSTYDDQGKIYAAVDVDSAPANCEPGSRNTYEDDTDSSPALKLEVAEARQLKGSVFLDTTPDGLMTGQIRLGDGEFKDGEKGIENVDVTLTENSGSNFKAIEVKTDKDGNFVITDYIPGDYTLTYTWGDSTYTVQNYKGTIYVDQNRYNSYSNNKYWYRNEATAPRYSDAIDNYDQKQDAPKGSRLQIDEELKTVRHNSEVTRTKMDSTTPTMGLGVEYAAETSSFGDELKYIIENIDFGIVRRAQQSIELSKRIQTLKATLSNGEVLANIQIDENGNVTGNSSKLTYMAPSENTYPKNGYVRLELDNELIQGTKLEVGYNIVIKNKGELDYISENYYNFGTDRTDVVTISPSKIVDYLDNGWSFNEETNSQWQPKTLQDLQEFLAEDVYSKEGTTISEKLLLYTDTLSNTKLEPTQEVKLELNVSKQLSTTDEISLDNEIETVEITKTGGSKIDTIPGNYVPGTGRTETDDDMAETTIVTPSTGENQNYIMIITIGIGTLIILAVGIVIIKKKAMRE